MVGPAVSQDAENIFWYYYCYKSYCCFGSCWTRFYHQTATAALVAGQVDGVFAKVLYDNAAIGGYIKVTGTTVTSATSLLNVLKSIL
jgi:hypothetical protein